MINNFMDQFKEIVYEAGKLILPATEISIEKEKEGVANFVTKYDIQVQNFLIQRLSELLPEASFLGEEEGQDASPSEEKYCFIIDPIDGTTNFICNFQYSAISVALICNGIPTYGIVYNPFRNEMFWAEKGNGAYLNNTKLTSYDRPLNAGVAFVDICPYNTDLRGSAFTLAQELSYHTMDLRITGSSALNLCYVACGRAVLFCSPRLCVWDYAAAEVLLNEMGYPLTDFKGAPLKFRTKVNVVASTPTAYKQFGNFSAPSLFIDIL